MKIMFYINTLGRGGAERVVVNLASAFYNSGIDIVLVNSFKVENEYEYEDGIKRICLDDNRKKSRLVRNLKRIFKLRRACLKEKPDVLISFMAEPNFRTILATFGLKTKTIISVRNDPEKEYSGKLGTFVGRYILKYADGCVFQTEDASCWFPEKLRVKSIIIPNAVQKKFFEVQWNPQKKEIVAIGRLVPQKDYVNLIRAMVIVQNKVTDVKLLIYGEGPEKTKIEALIEELDLSETIALKGVTSDVQSVLSKAACFVLCSEYEGMPNSLMEALTVGVPSVATDCPCGGPKYLIKQQTNGILVPVHDEKKLADALIKILLNDEFAKTLHTNAVVSSIKYSEEKVSSLWLQYIKEIIFKSKNR